jgi:hypothetical protein
MRRYVRYPSDVPIEYRVEAQPDARKERLNNVSERGLCFICTDYIPPDTAIEVKIHLVKPFVQLTGQVVWCCSIKDVHQVGVVFEEGGNSFILRMVEQLCYIEQYKQEVLHRNGRHLTGEEAAREWIERYADAFPD